MRRTFLIDIHEARGENQRRFLNFLLVISELRVVLIFGLNAFHVGWVFKEITAIPVTFIDIAAMLVFPAVFVLNAYKPKVILSYFYLVFIVILTGSNLWESYSMAFNVVAVVSLSIPIIAASFITMPVMSIVFSAFGCVELVIVAAGHSALPDASLLVTILFIGFLGWYTVNPLERALTRSEQSESNYLELVDELEQRVQEKVEELDITRKALDQHEKLAMLGKFASTVSHDLRTPLGVISNSIYFLEQHLDQVDEKTCKHFLLIKNSVNRAANYLSELLDFIRGQEPNPVPSDVNQILGNLLESLAVPGNISCISNLDTTIPTINVDPIQIQRAFQNIIVNAIQAMGEAAGTLTITTACKNNAVEVEIEDTGPGIPDDLVQHIFEPFFTTKSKGIGLGLPAAKEFITKNHGEISFRTAVGKGTTFTISMKL